MLSFRKPVAIAVGILTTVSFGHAQVRDNEEVLAARGNGEVTHQLFKARIDRIPEEHRFAFIRDRSRMEEVLNQMLIVMQLATDAREAGFDRDPDVMARMELAATEELAKAWMENYLVNSEPANYTAMAREEYLINQDKYLTLETVDVSHILIKTEGRSEEEALELALELAAQLDDDPALFEAFVDEYSEDTSRVNNQGSFTGVKRGDMVPEFEEASFSMDVGVISEPVQSQYGYHIIRKDGETPAQQKPFEQVQPVLERQMREQHMDRERRLYLNELYDPELEVTQESVEQTIELLFGRDVLAKYNEDGESG